MMLLDRYLKIQNLLAAALLFTAALIIWFSNADSNIQQDLLYTKQVDSYSNVSGIAGHTDIRTGDK